MMALERARESLGARSIAYFVEPSRKRASVAQPPPTSRLRVELRACEGARAPRLRCPATPSSSPSGCSTGREQGSCVEALASEGRLVVGQCHDWNPGIHARAHAMPCKAPLYTKPAAHATGFGGMYGTAAGALCVAAALVCGCLRFEPSPGAEPPPAVGACQRRTKGFESWQGQEKLQTNRWRWMHTKPCTLSSGTGREWRGARGI